MEQEAQDYAEIDPISNKKMIARYQMAYGQFTVHEHYMVAQINYGENLDRNTADDVRRIINKHFKKRDFGYITLRLNSYSVNPHIYKTEQPSPYLKGFAIVDPQGKNSKAVPIEKMFFSGKMQVFNDYKKAVAWILHQVFNS